MKPNSMTISPRKTRSSAGNTPKSSSKSSASRGGVSKKTTTPAKKSATKQATASSSTATKPRSAGKENKNRQDVYPVDKSVKSQAAAPSPAVKASPPSAESPITVDATPSKPAISAIAPNSIAKTPLAKYLLDAKQAFRRCSTPTKLVGRDLERKVITDFIKGNFAHHLMIKNNSKKEHSGALYISGMPGTGKSALVNEILQDESLFPKTRAGQSPLSTTPSGSSKKGSSKSSSPAAPFALFINCMALTSKTIFKHLVKEFKQEHLQSGSTGVAASEGDLLILQSFVTKPGPAIILVLDEIDHLLTKDQDVLYKFFELASYPHSRLALIGIANALDLTTRFLPRLQAKNFEPLHLSFAPYNAEEISAIIKNRLNGLDPGTPMTPGSILKEGSPANTSAAPSSALKAIMQPMAIELAARKLAGTGDLRKALDVCRHAIALVENDETPQVTVKHILKVTSSLLGNSSKSRIQVLNSLPKLVLTIFALLYGPPFKVRLISLGEFYDKYRDFAKKRSKTLGCASSSEFQDAVGQLEASGLVQTVTKKGKKLLALSCAAEDVLEFVKGTPLIDSIIADGLS